MSELSYFLAGFLTAAAICSGLAAAYYLRARRRVESIKQAISRYQQAQSVVGEAVNQAYGNNSCGCKSKP